MSAETKVDVLANWQKRDVNPAQVMRAMRDQGEWSDQAIDDINAAIICYANLVHEAEAFLRMSHSVTHAKRLRAALARVGGAK